MRKLQWQNRFIISTVKESSFSTEGMDNSYEFIYYCYNCFLITTKISLFANKVIPKVRVPLHNTYCHLEKNISDKARSLFGYAHSKFILTRLFHNWVCACILYKLLCIGEVSYIFNFSQKKPCKSLRDTFYGRNQFHLFFLVFIYSVHKYFFKLINSWLKEEELVNVEDEGFRKIGIINADRVFCSLDNFLWCKRSWFTSADRVFDNFRKPLRLSLLESFSRWVFVEDVKKRMGVDVEESLCFREKYSQAVFDLGFSFSEFMFKFLNEAGEATKLRVFRIEFKHLRVIESKESQYFSIFFVLFRGVVSRYELEESVDNLRVKYEGLDIFFNKEAIKGNVESTRRFHNNDRVSEGFDKVKEIRETLKGHGKFTSREDFAFLCKDAEMEIILRYVNTYIMTHNATSLFSRFLSLTPSSPVAGALLAQPTYWELRDRGTYSLGGSMAYKKWSPCPFLFYQTEKVSLRDILH